MTMRHEELERSVIAPLERQCRRLRAYRFLQGACVAFGVVLGLFAVQFALDYFLRLRRDTRAILLVGVIAVIGVALWRLVIKPLRVRFGVMDLAGQMEKRFGELNAVLISALQFHDGLAGCHEGNSPALQRAVIERAVQDGCNLPFDSLINSTHARRFGWTLAGMIGAVGLALFFVPATLGTWFDRNVLLSDVSWPKRTRLIVDTDEDGIIRAAIGDDVEIRATVDPNYEAPRQVDILFATAQGKSGRETMIGVGDRGFRASFPRVRDSFRFHLRGGDDITRWYEVRLSERPRVESATLIVTPPPYTQLPPVVLAEGQRSVELYAGSTLSIGINCNKPISNARLMSGGQMVGEAHPDGEGGWTSEVHPMASATYHFDLLDKDGLRNVRPIRFSARILQDHAPKVRLSIPDVGNLVTLEAVLSVEAEFSDDLGLAEADVFYRVSDGEQVSVGVEGFEAGQKLFTATKNWPIASTHAEVGSQVAVFARAVDFDDVSGPNDRDSAAVTFRIATAEELQADFARREQEFRRQFQRLMQSQERIRGELLSLLSRINDPQTQTDLKLLLAPFERRQRQLNAQVNLIRRQFEQLVNEMRINRLDTQETQVRLVEGIIAPLSQLAVAELTDSADLLRRLGRERTESLARTVDPLQARILIKMQSILDNMLKWEGYQETVNMLREILRLQRELEDETQRTIEREGSDVFDD